MNNPAHGSPAPMGETLRSRIVERARRIRCVALDVDGTLTDGGIHVGNGGELFKSFSVRDGFGLRLLREAGLCTAIVTGRSSDIVERRAAELGIAEVIQGSADKCIAVRQICARRGLDLQQLAFVGDDWPDLAVMQLAGLSAAPADADPQVLSVAHWVSSKAGGRGAVREFCEFLLTAQGRLDGLLRRYGGGGTLPGSTDDDHGTHGTRSP